MRFKPGMPEAVVRVGREIHVDADGDLRVDPHITVNKEIFEQYRQGYRCIKCHHGPQPEAFPVECVEPYCRFPMRERQMEALSRHYQGEIELWPDRGDEKEEIRETLGMHRFYANRAGILLPGD